MSEDIEAGGFPERLSQGYRAFLGDRFRREQERYEQQAEQQTPDTMVIGCCDSRVSPEVIFDAGPGELFVVRPRCRRSALKHVAVHALAPLSEDAFTGRWVQMMARAALRAG